jgi:hypothetical protein
MCLRSWLAVATVGIMGLLLAAPVHAQCTDASKLKTNCSVSECQTRQSKVHPTCDVPGGRTCNQSGLAKPELMRRLTINQNCKAVRQAVADCYKTPDSGHQQAISDAQRAIDECNRRIGQ